MNKLLINRCYKQIDKTGLPKTLRIKDKENQWQSITNKKSHSINKIKSLGRWQSNSVHINLKIVIFNWNIVDRMSHTKMNRNQLFNT